MGPESLPALRKAQTHSDPEVRRRVGQLLSVKEYAAILKPKRLTLHLRDKTIKEAVAELAKQSGYKVEVNNGAAAKADPEKQLVRLDLDNVTFWEAFDKLCTAGGLVYNDNIDDDGPHFRSVRGLLPALRLSRRPFPSGRPGLPAEPRHQLRHDAQGRASRRPGER